MEYMTVTLIGFAVLPTVYYFFLFRRILRTAGLDPKRPVFLIIELFLSAVVWHFTSQITCTPALFLYLVMGLDALVLLVNFLLKVITKKSNEEAGRKVWGEIFGFGLIPVVLVTVSFIIGAINIRSVVAAYYTVTTEKDISGEGCRVCFLSDVHCGIALTTEDFERISREIEAQEPDILILGGDLLDFKSEQQPVEEMFAAFGSIKTKKGSYYIFGNHDRTGDYKESLFTEEYIISLCEKNGITVLQDESVDLENGIVLYGREDATTKYGRIRMTPEELLKDADRSQFILIADHQPSDYSELASLGADLILGGHLHAGQIFPGNITLKMYNSEHVVWGRYRITQDGNKKMAADGPATEGAGTSTAIITSGLAGWAYEVKTSGDAEYLIIDIVPEK